LVGWPVWVVGWFCWGGVGWLVWLVWLDCRLTFSSHPSTTFVTSPSFRCVFLLPIHNARPRRLSFTHSRCTPTHFCSACRVSHDGANASTHRVAESRFLLLGWGVGWLCWLGRGWLGWLGMLGWFCGLVELVGWFGRGWFGWGGWFVGDWFWFVRLSFLLWLVPSCFPPFFPAFLPSCFLLQFFVPSFLWCGWLCWLGCGWLV